MEQWRQVLGYEGIYEVSNYGNLRSVDRINPTKAGWTRVIKGRRLRPFLSQDGRLFIDLCKFNVYERFPVHHLVLSAFIGARPDGFVGCHTDGNCLNNSASNLRWDTQKSNIADTFIHGTHHKGSRHGASKLHESDIAMIRIKYASGSTHKEIASGLGVSRELIGQILRGEKWTHVHHEPLGTNIAG